MPFDDDPEGTQDEAPFEAPESKDIFGNLTETQNEGGGFAEESGVQPESLTPPPQEQAAPAEAPQVRDEPRYVPLQEVQAERRRASELAAELQAHREMIARFDERMRVMHEQEQARLQAEWQAQQEPMPDPSEDPLGHQFWTQDQRLNQLSAELEQLRGYAGQADQIFQGQAVDAQINNVAGWTRAREAQYRAAVPDYDDAYRFLLRSRAEEYNAIGMTPEQIATRLQRDQGEVIALSTQYDQNGQPVGMPGNPCDTVYRLARARGFVPGQTKTDATGNVVGGNGNGNGRVDGRARLQAAQRAQRQAPGGRGGPVMTRPLDYHSISAMSDSDMAQLASTPQGRRMLDVAMGSR